MGRWTQYDEDSYRLPEDVKRVGYDADSSTYTFIDTNGVYYEGEPGEKYGRMSPVRPLGTSLFADGCGSKPPSPSVSSPTTFQDFLHPSVLASAGTEKTPSSPSLAKQRFVDAVRRVTMPKMYNVVVNAMRARNMKKIEEKDITRSNLNTTDIDSEKKI